MIRALDADGDWCFGNGVGSYLTGNAEIAQDVQTRLMCFQNDAFWDMGFGVDWWTLLGSLGANQTDAAILLQCRQMIITADGVTGITSVDSVITTGTRGVRVAYNISTVYSVSTSGSVTPNS